MELLVVGFGGFIGAIARYLIYLQEKSLLPHKFPIGTLVINLLGCFLAGIALSLGEKFAPTQKHLILFCTMGFISSFTTFSTFGVETLTLISSNQLTLAMTNIISNIVLGVVAIWLGKQIVISVCSI